MGREAEKEMKELNALPDSQKGLFHVDAVRANKAAIQRLVARVRKLSTELSAAKSVE